MNQKGFTLIEALVTLSVLAILLGIAIPSYGYLKRTVRLSSLSNELVVSLAFARSEAIKRGILVTVCKTANAASGSPSCQSTANWSDGWMIFTDKSSLGVMDGADSLLRVQAQPVLGIGASASNFTTHITYLATGRSRAPNNLSNGSVNFCKDGEKRSVILNATGRVRTTSGAC